MSLVTATDVLLRYPVMSSVGSTAVNSTWIVYAENEINGRLGAAFTVPFSSNNQTAIDLIIENTWLRYQQSKNSDLAAALRTAMDTRLARIMDGKEPMILADGTIMNASGGLGDAWSNTSGYHPVFGMGDETHFLVDSSQTYDEALARGEVV